MRKAMTLYYNVIALRIGPPLHQLRLYNKLFEAVYKNRLCQTRVDTVICFYYSPPSASAQR